MGRPDNDFLAEEHEKPERRVFLSPYWIDVYPVTNARFARFLDTVDPSGAKNAWIEAWEAFRKAIDLLPGNVEAILAFSHRLLDHAGVFDAQGTPTPASPRDCYTWLWTT